MRTIPVPWRVSRHERYAFHGWPRWLWLGVIGAIALAALALASCQVEARDTAPVRAGALQIRRVAPAAARVLRDRRAPGTEVAQRWPPPGPARFVKSGQV